MSATKRVLGLLLTWTLAAGLLIAGAPSASAAGAEVVPIAPVRIYDSRPDQPPGTSSGPRTALIPGQTVRVSLDTIPGVPADARGVVLNVTVAGVTVPGWVTVYPCGSPLPLASTLNVAPGEDTANQTLVDRDGTNAACVASSAAGALIIDAQGYLPTSSSLKAITPLRVYETRVDLGGVGTPAASEERTVQIAGVGNIPPEATAVLANVTSTRSQQSSHATVWPCGSSRPTASSLNFRAGEDRANAGWLRLGAGGTLCLVSPRSTDFVVDVAAYHVGPAGLSMVNPNRLVDTRSGFGVSGLLTPRRVVEFTIPGLSDTQGFRGGALLNVTTTGSYTNGHITVYPCGGGTPLVSNLNFAAARDRAVSVLVAPGSSGKICAVSSVATHLVVDFGGFANPGGYSEPKPLPPPGPPLPGDGDDPPGWSGNLPANTPYRDVFLTVGPRWGVEPALLAAIAAQESNFNPDANCGPGSSPYGGKGIMQHEGQAEYCGAGKVFDSVNKSAQMISGYKRSSGSWIAAIFAYNNGPGLMDEWMAYRHQPPTLIRVLTDHYNRQPYAKPGPYRGYATWGEWRAWVAYGYASPSPPDGFRSATQKWFAWR